MASVSKRNWTYNGQPKQAWVVRYFDDQGVRRSKQFEMKKAADAFKRTVERETEAGVHVAPGAAMSIRVLAAEYLVNAEGRHADGRIGINRLVSLRNTFRRRIVAHLGGLMIGDLTAARVEQFYADLQSRDGLAVRTSKDTVYDLQLLEAFARKRGCLKATPVTDALKDLRGTRRSVVRTFSAEQVGHLLGVVASRGHNFKARSAAMIECAVNLAAFCGLRYGEIMALDLASLDLERRIIRVRQSLLFNDTLKGPKTAAGRRDIPMPTRVRDLLSGWLEGHYIANDRDLIFRTPKATIISQANFHRQWTYLLARAGLDDGEAFHFHALRHFCASWMVDNGMPITDVAQLLGHSRFDTTLQVYAHPIVRPAARLAAFDAMAAALPTPGAVANAARVPQAA